MNLICNAAPSMAAMLRLGSPQKRNCLMIEALARFPTRVLAFPLQEITP